MRRDSEVAPSTGDNSDIKVERALNELNTSFGDDDSVDGGQGGQEGSRDLITRDEGQSLQADMARFPGKTRKQVIAARA